LHDEQQEKVICQICKEQKNRNEVIPAQFVLKPVVDLIRKEYPEWSDSSYICIADLNHFRARWVEEVLEEEKGEVTSLEEQVMHSMKEEELLSGNLNIEFDQRLTFGQRLADRLADFAGSWIFIGLFAGVLLVWIALNSFLLLLKPFDPYPFILLNLVLSCLAAIQAPVIMMSQNRQEARDRLQAERDYQVNLKAELEIHHLHEKMDHLLINQGQRLLEIQKIQIELMEELSRKSL
jgi:uncharacterized membrane protein